MRASDQPDSPLPTRPLSPVAVEERLEPVVHSDPEIMGGTPVFVGTRVPVDALFDYLGAGDNLDRFLDHFPTVQRHQAVAAIELSREALLETMCTRPL